MQPIYDNLEFLFRDSSEPFNLLDEFVARGVLEMESKRGEGTRFTIRLPLTTEWDKHQFLFRIKEHETAQQTFIGYIFVIRIFSFTNQGLKVTLRLGLCFHKD